MRVPWDQDRDKRMFTVRFDDGDVEDCSLAELVVKEEPSSSVPALAAAAVTPAAAAGPSIVEAVPVEQPQTDYHSELHDVGYTLIPEAFAQFEKHRDQIEQAFGTSRREFVFQTTPDESHDTSGDRRRLQAALVGDLGEGILASLACGQSSRRPTCTSANTRSTRS